MAMKTRTLAVGYRRLRAPAGANVEGLVRPDVDRSDTSASTIGGTMQPNADDRVSARF